MPVNELPTVGEIAERLHVHRNTVTRDLSSAIQKLKTSGQIHRFAAIVYLSQEAKDKSRKESECLAH